MVQLWSNILTAALVGPQLDHSWTNLGPTWSTVENGPTRLFRLFRLFALPHRPDSPSMFASAHVFGLISVQVRGADFARSLDKRLWLDIHLVRCPPKRVRDENGNAVDL